MPDEPDHVRHVLGSWRLRPFFQESEADEMERHLALLRHEAWMKIYRFAEPWPADIKDKIHALYKKDVALLPGGMGCMQAAYQCLETVHPGQPKYKDPKDPDRDSLRERVYDTSVNDKKFNGVALMMATLQKDGMAGEPATVTFGAKSKAFDPPPEAEVLKMFDPKQEGVYFFGVSVKGGNHTVILAVDNTPQADGKTSPRIFWLDQATRGLSDKSDVTGKLAEELAANGAKDPHNPTRIWALRPEQISRDKP